MELFKLIYGELKETYGSDTTIRSLCIGGGALLCSGGFAFIIMSLLLKPQQPIIIINEIQSIEDKSEGC